MAPNRGTEMSRVSGGPAPARRDAAPAWRWSCFRGEVEKENEALQTKTKVY